VVSELAPKLTIVCTLSVLLPSRHWKQQRVSLAQLGERQEMHSHWWAGLEKLCVFTARPRFSAWCCWSIIRSNNQPKTMET